jgi:hypothetical protein
MLYTHMEKIHADLIGIGKLLKQSRFTVPPHQRPYAWVEEQVNDLYRDINDAQKRKSEEYFLGTIVLATTEDIRRMTCQGRYLQKIDSPAGGLALFGKRARSSV